MLFLITGTNSAGKTLNTLKWVRERQIKESRPVCYNGRFEMVEGGELKDWKKIEFADWEKEPDGTIFVIDECQFDMPAVSAGAKRPDCITNLAVHRKRGFDFYMITQHPGNMDSFVRRLIGSPGWHRHLKRPFGGTMVSCAEYPAVNDQCHKQNAGKNAEMTMIPFPKEVFGWYVSASMHTVKRRLPKQVFILALAVVLVPILFYVAYVVMSGLTAKPEDATTAEARTSTGTVTQPAGQSQGQKRDAPMTKAEYLASYTPRIEGLAYTAPRYDQITQPVTAPRPAACLQMGTRCECFSQQGTKLPGVPANLCQHIVKNGYFEDFASDPGNAHIQQRQDNMTKYETEGAT